MKRLVIVACCLLAGCARPTNPQATIPDEVIGKAVFEVQKSVGGHALMLPQARVGFGVTRIALKGADLPDGVAICTILKRRVTSSDQLQSTISITVLKCGSYEYGISEVLFDLPADKH